MNDPKKMALLIPRLQELQHEQGWLSDASLRAIAAELDLPIYHVHGVASFYPHFLLEPPPRVSIHVCQDLLCHLKHGGTLIDRVRAASTGIKDVQVRGCSCLGQCDRAPAAMINEWPYAAGNEPDLLNVIRAAINGGELLRPRTAPMPGPFKSDPYPTRDDRFTVLKQLVDSIKELKPADARKVLERVPQTLIDAGLRGMGGAAFPVGLKWKGLLDARAQSASKRYIVCNADECEVGTFKDREILRNLPHLVVEAMAIAALVTNATRGYFYIRHEYVEQIEAVQEAIDHARALGAIGPDVFGSGRAFELTVFVSPGGYIQGEASALLEAIEGKRGQPRNGTDDFGATARSTVRGLFNMPTIVNNVESFLYVPAILKNGADWFKSLGEGANSGLKFVGIGGDVTHAQVLEVKHGMTFADALEKCGGMKGGKKLKAIMPSGPSFGFLPPDFIDAGMEFPNKDGYGKLARAGASIVSAAVIFLNEDRDLVDAALNCTKFYRNESCGKCVPCRVGSQKMVDIIEGVVAGSAGSDDLAQVQRLSDTLYLTSICGLGKVVPKPFETVVKYWGDTDDRIRQARGHVTTSLTVGGKTIGASR